MISLREESGWNFITVSRRVFTAFIDTAGVHWLKNLPKRFPTAAISTAPNIYLVIHHAVRIAGKTRNYKD